MSQANRKQPFSRNNRKVQSVKRQQPTRFAKKTSFNHPSKKPVRMNRRGRKPSKKNYEYPLEYESHTKMEIPRHFPIRQGNSNQSVIYVKSFPPKDNLPVIDLTKSNHHLKYAAGDYSSSFGSNTSLKLIYKSSNFGKIQKQLTTSLVSIPLKRKPSKQRKIWSTSKLLRCSKEKIATLDLPEEYYDEDTDCSEYSFYDASKAELNDDDKKMMDYVLMNEDDRSSKASSHKYVKLDAKQPFENMCQLYGVTSRDTFD